MAQPEKVPWGTACVSRLKQKTFISFFSFFPALYKGPIAFYFSKTFTHKKTAA